MNERTNMNGQGEPTISRQDVELLRQEIQSLTNRIVSMEGEMQTIKQQQQLLQQPPSPSVATQTTSDCLDQHESNEDCSRTNPTCPLNSSSSSVENVNDEDDASRHPQHDDNDKENDKIESHTACIGTLNDNMTAGISIDHDMELDLHPHTLSNEDLENQSLEGTIDDYELGLKVDDDGCTKRECNMDHLNQYRKVEDTASSASHAKVTKDHKIRPLSFIGLGRKKLGHASPIETQIENNRDTFTHNTSLRNTETLHMYAIATIVDAVQTRSNGHEAEGTTLESLESSFWKRQKARLFSFISLVLVCLQMLVLFFVISELSNQTCTLHTDCRTGYFCAGIKETWKQPRCMECGNSEEDFMISSSQCETLFQDESIVTSQDIDQTVIWFARDYEPHYNFNVTTIQEYADEELLRCLELQHCDDTALVGDSGENLRGHWTLNANRLSSDQIITLSIIAILFGGIIARDLLEVDIEYATLNVVIRHVQHNHATNGGMPLAIEAIRLSLRLREIIMPFMAAGATCSVLIMDSLSPKNILLNFLALSFLHEADNILARIFLSQEQQTLIDKVLFHEDAIMQLSPYQALSPSMKWSKFSGVLISISIVILACNVTTIMVSSGWSSVVWLINIFMHVGIMLNMVIHVAKNIAGRKSDQVVQLLHTLHSTMIGSLMSLSIYYVVLVCGSWILFSGSYWLENYLYRFHVGIISSFIFVAIELCIECFMRYIKTETILISVLSIVIILLVSVHVFLNTWILRELISSGTS